MSEEEPAGLNMSLDDIIKTSAEVRVKSGRVAEYDHSGRGGGHSGRGDTGEFKGIHCFDCMRAGFPTVFSSKQELVAHKAIGIHLGQGQQKGIHCFDCKRLGFLTNFSSRDELASHKAMIHGVSLKNKRDDTPHVGVKYIWSAEGTPEESLSILQEDSIIIKITASGDVEIHGNVRHLASVYSVLNTCLTPISYKVTLTNNDLNGEWIISNASGWKKPLDTIIKVSAFTRRSWSTIRTQLKQLPESIPVVDPTAPQNKRQATSGSSFQATHGLGLGQGQGHGMTSVAGGGGGAFNPMMMQMMMPMMMQMSLPFMMAQQAAATGGGGGMGMGHQGMGMGMMGPGMGINDGQAMNLMGQGIGGGGGGGGGGDPGTFQPNMQQQQQPYMNANMNMFNHGSSSAAGRGNFGPGRGQGHGYAHAHAHGGFRGGRGRGRSSGRY
eukprot:gene9838-20459_t